MRNSSLNATLGKIAGLLVQTAHRSLVFSVFACTEVELEVELPPRSRTSIAFCVLVVGVHSGSIMALFLYETVVQVCLEGNLGNKLISTRHSSIGIEKAERQIAV